MTKTSSDAVKIAQRMVPEASPTPAAPLDTFESTMQKLSLVVSIIALGLMLGGFVELVLQSPALALPGSTALSLAALVGMHWPSFSVVTMSAGIVLLALLPAARVVLAAMLYYRKHMILDTLIAVIVLAELLLSTRLR